MNIEWARNMGAIILIASAVILSIYLAGTNIKDWQGESKYLGHELGQEQYDHEQENNAIIFRIAAIWLIVLLVFVGTSLSHFTSY